jgi:hypothetical protein
MGKKIFSDGHTALKIAQNGRVKDNFAGRKNTLRN